MLRGWHDVYVRFGSNTLKTFGAESDPGIVLGEDDIFFAGHRPGVAAVGRRRWPDLCHRPRSGKKRRCADDACAIFHEVRRHWLATGATGRELYDFASDCAQRRGWVLNLDLSGHRIGDFPHAAIHEARWPRSNSSRHVCSGCWKSISAIRTTPMAPSMKTCCWKTVISRHKLRPRRVQQGPRATRGPVCAAIRGQPSGQRMRQLVLLQAHQHFGQ